MERSLLTVREVADELGVGLTRAQYLVKRHHAEIPTFRAKSHKRRIRLFDEQGFEAIRRLFTSLGEIPSRAIHTQ